MDPESLRLLIMGVVPLLIAAAKLAIPRFPRRLIPILVPILGAALDLVGYATGALGTSRPVAGAVLGALGLWLREVLDQLRQALRPPDTPAS